METENVTKVAILKKKFYLSYKSTLLAFFLTVLFKYFIRQTLTDDFWGLKLTWKKALLIKKACIWKLFKHASASQQEMFNFESEYLNSPHPDA